MKRNSRVLFCLLLCIQPNVAQTTKKNETPCLEVVKKQKTEKLYYIELWKGLNEILVWFKAASYFAHGYGYIITDSMTGPRNNFSLKDLLRREIMLQQFEEKIQKVKKTFLKEIQAIKSALAAKYKIHLMPRDSHLEIILLQLLNRLQNTPKFAQSVRYLKIKQETQKLVLKNVVYPKVVIYPADSKECAQYVLNTVYTLFKTFPGLGLRPRYNKRVTDLIYYAQGDGDFKRDHLARYYEPERVLYKPDFEGTVKDYRLVLPHDNLKKKDI